jgi:signal transduction histidine kinase
LTHELKTPITGIKAFLQTIQQQEMSREELLPLVAMALREVERQEMLAENLLVGQRIERAGLGLQLKPFKLAQRVRDFFDEHRIIIPEGALHLEFKCSEDTRVLADPDGLWVILENLTDNALKYGGDSPEITCEVAETEKHGVVVISDRGVGFDPSHSSRIFDAYHRLTDELPGGRHGTGMGLYLSRRLARKMGGNLRAESEGPDRGASFIITLKKA